MSALSRAGARSVPVGLKGKGLATKQARKHYRTVVKAEDDDEAAGVMADIGLGDLEDVMEKASGGSTGAPDFLPSEFDGVFELLGSENTDMAQTLLVEKYGETLYRGKVSGCS